MTSKDHARIEAIAGAIALGEAGDDERREYREHIAACSACLTALGGEHEIERVASTVSQARDSEIWQPQLGDVVATRLQRRKRAIRYGAALTAFALALSFGVEALIAGHSAPAPHHVVKPVQQVASAMREPAIPERVTVQPRAVVVPQRHMIVEHNIVHMTRAPVAAPPVGVQPPIPDAKPPEIAAVVVHPQLPAIFRKSRESNVPIWRRKNQDSWRTVATTTTTSLSESAPQTFTHRAELMQVSPPHVEREATPIGGETAINPQPPMIAYDEGAQGTSVFEVLIDDHGNPTKCVITKPAGYPVLDKAVCSAAMQARYLPKLVDGRAVSGVYRDAFTFRMSQDDQNVEGIPKTIPMQPQVAPTQQP